MAKRIRTHVSSFYSARTRTHVTSWCSERTRTHVTSRYAAYAPGYSRSLRQQFYYVT